MTMTTLRGESGRFSTVGVTLETAAKIRKLAGNRAIYQVLDELVDKALAGSQAGLGGGFGGGAKPEDKDTGVVAKLTRIFGSPRGRDVLQKMEQLNCTDEYRQHVCTFLIEAEHFDNLEFQLVWLQGRLAEQLSGRVPLPAFGKLAEA